jgi:hypothetical protein
VLNNDLFSGKLALKNVHDLLLAFKEVDLGGLLLFSGAVMLHYLILFELGGGTKLHLTFLGLLAIEVESNQKLWPLSFWLQGRFFSFAGTALRAALHFLALSLSTQT